MTSGGGFTIVDFTIPTRDVPVVHPCAEAPICNECRSNDMCFFDPMCSGCQEVLSNPKTTISEIFAIMRQWVPQTQGHLNLLTREILRRGAHINDKDGLTDLSVLHYACKAGADGMGSGTSTANLVNSLINKGADTSLKCHWTDMNALHYAVLFDCHLVVEQLCQHNPALVCTVSAGGNALHIAAAHLCLESAKVLIKYNCDGGLKDNDGKLPQDYIPKIISKKEEGVANELLELLKEAAANRPQPKPRIRHSSSNASLPPVTKSPVSTKSPTFTKSPAAAAKSPVGKLSSAKNKLAVTESNSDTIPNGKASAISREDSKDSRSSSRRSPVPPSPNSMNNGILGPSPDDVTLDTLGIKVGDKVLIDAGTSKSKRGTLRFAGGTMFASGQWAGIELEDEKGRNDGSQGGIRYFSCKPKRGLFVSLKRISKYSSSSSSKIKKPLLAEKGKSDSVRSVESPPHLSSEYKIGDRVKVSSMGTGTLRYTGDVTFAPGIWLGVELDRAMGNTNGTKGGHQYFKCKNNFGTFVLPSKVTKIVDNAELGTITPPNPTINVTPPISRRKQPVVGTRSSTPRTKTHSYTSPVPSSLSLASASDPVLEKGMSVFVNKEIGIVQFIGHTDFAPGIWLGVELRKPCGKNDGSVNGKRYFSCRQAYGIFVKPEKATHRGFNCSKLIKNDHF